MDSLTESLNDVLIPKSSFTKQSSGLCEYFHMTFLKNASVLHAICPFEGQASVGYSQSGKTVNFYLGRHSRTGQGRNLGAKAYLIHSVPWDECRRRSADTTEDSGDEANKDRAITLACYTRRTQDHSTEEGLGVTTSVNHLCCSGCAQEACVPTACIIN